MADKTDVKVLDSISYHDKRYESGDIIKDFDGSEKELQKLVDKKILKVINGKPEKKDESNPDEIQRLTADLEAANREIESLKAETDPDGKYAELLKQYEDAEAAWKIEEKKLHDEIKKLKKR